MNPRAALEAAVAGCLRRIATMDRGWKASALGIGLVGLALVL